MACLHSLSGGAPVAVLCAGCRERATPCGNLIAFMFMSQTCTCTCHMSQHVHVHVHVHVHARVHVPCMYVESNCGHRIDNCGRLGSWSCHAGTVLTTVRHVTR
eukprot:6229615-Prymnesium_polylepis.1